MVEQYECQADRHLSGGHGEDEQEHDLAIWLRPPRSCSNESQTARIEHDLNAHEREDEVTPREKSCQTQQKQDRRENQCVLHRHW